MLRLKRESFDSRMCVVTVSAGRAIGIGNVWRFPTVTGQYGGGVFVLFYLLFLVLMGVPVLTMELAVGRGCALGGGGDIFRLYETPDANAAQQFLARHHIWSRIFPYSTRWMRMGLPGGGDEWPRVQAALAGGS